MSKKLLNTQSIEIHCISAAFAVRCGHVLLSCDYEELHRL